MTSEAAAVGAVGRFRLHYLRIRPDSMSGMTAVYPQHSLSLCLRSPGGLNWQPGFRMIARAIATRSVSRDAPQVSSALRRAARNAIPAFISAGARRGRQGRPRAGAGRRRQGLGGQIQSSATAAAGSRSGPHGGMANEDAMRVRDCAACAGRSHCPGSGVDLFTG